MMTTTAGRPKCGVWNYFKYDEKEDTSVCMVQLKSREDSDISLCSKSFKGKVTTNLKLHLKKEHTKEYKLIEQEEKKKKEKEKERDKKKPKNKTDRAHQSLSIQPSLTDIAKQKKMYEIQSAKQRSITKKLAIFVGASNVALSLVENVEFLELIHELDPRYHVPGRFKIGKELDLIYSKLRRDLTESLNSAERISLCADIWSKKGMSAAFLGLTAHCYHREKKQKYNVTIAVRRFESPHTAERVTRMVDNILDEWKIPFYKVFRILTDNGSNMLAAFKQDLQLRNDDELMDDTLGLEIIDVTDEDNESNEITEGEETAAEDAFIALGQNQQDHSANYEECESQHDINLASYQRVSCFIHTLQLVVHTYDKSSHLRSTMTKAQKVVHKINKSVKATEMLIKKARKKLVNACPTRWSSTFLMITRLLELKSSVISVCEDLGWECLSSYQWKQLESIEFLLKPFAQYTTLTSGEENTTISIVIPVLLELEMHLKDEIEKKSNATMTIAKKMLENLKQRFAYATDVRDSKFDPIFVTATFLNPAYKAILEDVQVRAAIRYLKELCKPTVQETLPNLIEDDDATYVPEVEIPVDEVQESEPPSKRPRLLSRVALLLKEKQKDKGKNTCSSEEKEIERYNQEQFDVKLEDDPLHFWANTKDFPAIASVACDVLCTPASTAPIERVFSTSGESTSGKRNRLADYNLEREVLIRKNKGYL